LNFESMRSLRRVQAIHKHRHGHRYTIKQTHPHTHIHTDRQTVENIKYVGLDRHTLLRILKHRHSQTYTHTHTQTHARACAHTHTRTHTHAHTHTQTHRCLTHSHTHKQTHTHTHTIDNIKVMRFEMSQGHKPTNCQQRCSELAKTTWHLFFGVYQ